MSEPTTYALPPEPEGPVWDRNEDKWERTGEMLHVHGREWAEWRHVASGDMGTWPAPLMRGPVTSTPPWKPEVGGVCETHDQYEAMPDGSVAGADGAIPVYYKRADGLWCATGQTDRFADMKMAGTSRTILRVGWSL